MVLIQKTQSVNIVIKCKFTYQLRGLKLTKLVIDYPVKYTSLLQGDVTFVLAHLYLKNQNYKMQINKLKSEGRPLMLDNGAWEFGSSMPPTDYLNIIKNLEPDYAVIPDVYRNRWQSEKMTKEFIEINDSIVETQLMFVPQGESIDEIIDSHEELVSEFGMFYDVLAVAKHIGSITNRVDFVNNLVAKSNEPPVDVHFLGFWNWDEFDTQKVGNWNLISLDTKYPVKGAIDHKFTDQLEYYNTNLYLDEDIFNIEVDTMYLDLYERGWSDD